MEQQFEQALLERRRFLSLGAQLAAFGAASAFLPLPLLAKVASKYPTVRKNIDAYIAAKKLPGLVGALGTGTAAPEIIAAGTISLTSKKLVDADTLWRIYSMTKPIAGIAAMILVEDGKLKLDQPIADILPEFANMKVLTKPDTSLESVPAKTQITVRHLLTHTAGLGYTIITKGPLLKKYQELGLNPAIASRFPMPGADPVAPTPDIATFSKRLASLPLIAEPGTKWSYSVSLDLLGHVIGTVSGMEFGAFLKQRIFDPLGMKSTFFHLPKAQAGRLVTNYAPYSGLMLPVDTGEASIYLDKPAFSFGGSGLISSARDYDRFLAMLLGKGTLDGKRVMKPKTVELATSNLLPAAVNTKGSLIDGHGFGAGGRVGLGESAGTYGWGGAAGTIAFIHKSLNVRGTGMAQYFPSTAFPYPEDFIKWALADVMTRA